MKDILAKLSGRLFAGGFITRGLVVSAVCLGIVGNALAAPGDYDGDGKSDFSVGLVNRNSSANTGTTAWLTRPSNGAAALFWTWQVPADAYVSGRFFVNDPKYYPGVVWVRNSALPLEWYIKNAAGQDVFLQYGLPGDTITNLGDFDGDGRDDITVVRTVGDFLHWYIAQTSNGVVTDYLFGVKGDKPFASDVDGDGQAEMVVLREGFWWYAMKPGAQTFSTVQWGLPGDFPFLPQDLDNDGEADYIISRKTGTLQLAYIRYSNNGSPRVANVSLGYDTSVPQIGNFTGTPDFAWTQRDTGWNATRNGSGAPSFFLFGIPTNAIIRADGTVVQSTQAGTYPDTTVGGTDPDDGDTGETPPDDGNASCQRVYSSGWLLKPASQDSGGSRQGKPLILFSSNYPRSGCLNIIATNGSVVAHYGQYSSNRFYSGWGCGEGYSGSQIASRANSAAGSKNIYVQDPSTGACYGPGPADGRTDRR